MTFAYISTEISANKRSVFDESKQNRLKLICEDFKHFDKTAETSCSNKILESHSYNRFKAKYAAIIVT